MAYQREVGVFGAGEKVEVPNFGTSDFEFVDSLAGLMKLQKEFAGGDYYQKWQHLRKWADMDLQQKMKVYDEFVSHELNFFIFMKDE